MGVLILLFSRFPPPGSEIIIDHPEAEALLSDEAQGETNDSQPEETG